MDKFILLNCRAFIWFTVDNKLRGDRDSVLRGWKYVLCCLVSVVDIIFNTFIVNSLVAEHNQLSVGSRLLIPERSASEIAGPAVSFAAGG